MNVVSVAYQILDVEDYQKKKYNAFLGTDGQKMRVSAPTLPNWMYGNVAEIYKLEGAAACKQTKNAHLAAANEMVENEKLLTKDMIFKFPDGITCKTDIFNKKQDDHKLKNNFRLMDQTVKLNERQTLKMKIPFVVWKFVIDEKKRILEQLIGDDDDDVIEAISRMSMNMSV